MKHSVISAIIILLSVISSSAQDEKKPEFFGGYSLENFSSGITSNDLGTTTTLDNRFNANGFHLAGTGFLTKRLGLTADFSAHFDTRHDLFGSTTGQSKVSLYNLTGGPQFRFLNSSRFTPFVEGLAGIARRNLSETFGATSFTDNPTSFALNLGGGIDYRINDRFAVRVLQLDYNPIFARARTVNATAIPDRTITGFRFSTGIVIR